MATEFPNRYDDPLYASLDAKTEQKLGLPTGLLSNIRVSGEKSNANQVSEAQAKTPYQFIPATRQAVLDKYGIDPLLSPETASEAAGLLLKESLDRNKGDAAAAVGEYHGGTNRDNWGPRTKAYVNRVMIGQRAAGTSALENDFAKFMAMNPAVPAGRSAAAVPAPAATPTQGGAESPLEQGFAQFLQNQKPPEPPAPEPSLLQRAGDVVTGALRRTPETDALPDWAGMPELNSLSLASAKTGLGTMLSNPAETAQIIKANFPDAQVRQDDKGNFLIRSAADGQEYAIKPGFQVSDIPRALFALAAFTPAGRATTITGGAAAAAGTQAAIEASQAATGGSFSSGEVAMAGAGGAAVPAIARASGAAIDAGKAALARLRGAPEPVAAIDPVAAARQAAREAAAVRAAPEEPIIVTPDGTASTQAQRAAAAQPEAAAATEQAATQSAAELAQTARKAAQGGFGSKRATQVLAEQAAPDAATVAAAKRLGIEEHLQPDHVTTNQAYRELAQAVKSIPGSEGRAAEIQGLDKVAQRATDLIDEIGGTSDVSALNASVKQRMQATQQALEKQADDLYAKVREQIPLKAEAPANNVLGFIRQRAEEVGGVENLSPMERRIVARLSPKTTTRTEATPVDPDQVGLIMGRKPAQKIVEVVKQPTYALLDDVRRDLGSAARKAGPFKDADTGLAKKLYSLATDDQAAVVGSHGATELFDAARASVAVRKGLEDDLVSLFGKALDGSFVGALSGAVRALPQGDTSKLLRLLNAIPADQRQQVVASGIASAFRTAGTRGPINFGIYAKWYEGLLRNKQAHTAIMANLPPAARKQLSDLYRVSKGISDASRERIQTGRIMAVKDELKGADNLVSRLYDVAQKSAVGATVGTAAGAFLGPGVGAAVASALTGGAKTSAMKATDALIASPEFAQLARQAVPRPADVRRFAYSKAFSRYVHAVGNPRDLSNREKWVLQVVQGRNNSQD